MGFVPSPEAAGSATGPSAAARRPPTPVKVVIAGGFGVGKTTAVRSISDIAPLTTEALMTEAAAGIDDGRLVPVKSTTTVAMDFGRIRIDDDLVLYLFGTPGQDRFGFMWADLAEGAFGALVIVDSRRLEDSFAVVDRIEQLGLPYVVAVNAFDGSTAHDLGTVRWALALDPEQPVVAFDARDRRTVRDALVVLLHRVLAYVQTSSPVG
ncbi:ATP/GTP-binding protein [Streptomyces sp. TLI_171]|uniref:GTP-binding protein n=1 Tax=Streptomyces sp. TLI_171 TaxID=1938859 RepID=UPI000C190187|nr:ATP/GTP-binding protein [Streptomyces sp. TLI_171]RKE22049.1 hypothetical protein BX266_5460 [Streptomyces sp. TLI_171]